MGETGPLRKETVHEKGNADRTEGQDVRNTTGAQICHTGGAGEDQRRNLDKRQGEPPEMGFGGTQRSCV